MATQKNQNQTKVTTVDPVDFIAAVEHDTRREDAQVLLDWMGEVTGYSAKMWGPTIVGYGRYHYVYDTGREGDWMQVGFSPRKANLVIYLLPGYEDLSDQLGRLGKHKIGKSCLYVNKLSDIDMAVLEEMVLHSLEALANMYDTYPE